ncbi:MAG: TIR domain-containing protein [Aphanizomenon flos-aquae KM1D3_PB]|uniref:GUN4 domain-containing protein n=1 Tax=Aphanizomenon flos-aquae TaxID=1176 RepID=UPI000689B7E3|nr:GUN4 domain-containing protein [Aphanizomenon flos-aquae]QSV73574.1 MAG: TIR domain-containing protein [Aphanizomenon flos-aquae KM1D3_PB]
MKVFISHCSTDKPFVERLANDLHERESISCWFDKEGIGIGDSIPAKIGEALSNASIFVVVLSVEGVNSTWVNYEINTWLILQFEEEKLAKQQSRTPNRRIAPVLYRDCQIPTVLQSFLRVSINEQNYEYGFKQLVQGIRGEYHPLKNPPVTPSKAMPSQSIVFNLLKDLLPFQFKTVLLYKVLLGYTKLELLLKEKKWKDADLQTVKIMHKLLNLKSGEYMSSEDLPRFSCYDLCMINDLWIKYSNNMFGFSIQKNIYEEVLGQETNFDSRAWQRFGKRVGWYKEKKWMDDNNYQNGWKNAPKGYFPLNGSVSGEDWNRDCKDYFSEFMLRLKECDVGENIT